jgi:hypothetical protein
MSDWEKGLRERCEELSTKTLAVYADEGTPDECHSRAAELLEKFIRSEVESATRELYAQLGAVVEQISQHQPSVTGDEGETFCCVGCEWETKQKDWQCEEREQQKEWADHIRSLHPDAARELELAKLRARLSALQDVDKSEMSLWFWLKKTEQQIAALERQKEQP